MAHFVLSPEFTGQNDDTQFVRKLYFAVLGRGASPEEIDFYVGRLQAGTSTRASVLENFLRSPESIGRVVSSDYAAYLKRQPGTDEVTFWVQRVQGGTTFGSVAIALLGSQEFFNNGGPYVLP
jgi:hypothetical protein